jgi:hypothetical protein
MNPRIPKTIGWLLCCVLLAAVFSMGWKLKSLEKQAAALSSNIRKTEQATERFLKEADAIWVRFGGRWRELEKNTVPMAEPIVWCVGWVRNQVGLADEIGIECVGVKTFNGMATGRPIRDATEGTMACLAPYAIQLDLRKTTLGKLQYVLGQIESPRSPGIVKYLKVDALESGDGYSATAIVYLPSFQYLEDWQDIREFFASGNSEASPAEKE